MMVEASVATPAGFSRSRIDTARAPTGLIVGTKWEHCTLGQREHQELEAIKINQNQVRAPAHSLCKVDVVGSIPIVSTS
jgi:hypothetical protein